MNDILLAIEDAIKYHKAIDTAEFVKTGGTRSSILTIKLINARIQLITLMDKEESRWLGEGGR